MKKIVVACVLVCGVIPAAAETIPARDAPDYYGQVVTVVGRVHIQRMPSGEIFLDLAGRGDGAPVSAYVSRWNAGPFGTIDDLDGKLVAVRGEIGSFRYRPEIFLTDPGQIARVEPPAKVEAAPKPLWIHIPPERK
jgi:hypothetical protein